MFKCQWWLRVPSATHVPYIRRSQNKVPDIRAFLTYFLTFIVIKNCTNVTDLLPECNLSVWIYGLRKNVPYNRRVPFDLLDMLKDSVYSICKCNIFLYRQWSEIRHHMLCYEDGIFNSVICCKIHSFQSVSCISWITAVLRGCEHSTSARQPNSMS
jgi:hypothetical protein